jgi:hypothetical protein
MLSPPPPPPFPIIISVNILHVLTLVHLTMLFYYVGYVKLNGRNTVELGWLSWYSARQDVQGLIPRRGKSFSALHSVHACSGAHPASYTMGTGQLISLGVELTTHLHLMLRSRMLKLYLHSLIYLHYAVLNGLSTGTA